MASYARTWERFVRERISLVGISVDHVEKLLLPFRLLSDSEGCVIKEWGVWTDGKAGIARPSIFAIWKDCSIAW